MSSIEEVKREIINLCEEYKNSSSDNYDFWNEHIKYVYEEGIELAKKYGADIEIVSLGCLLHDIALIKKVGTKVDHHINGKILAEEILKKYFYPKEKMDRILGCVYNHRSSKNANNIEELCVCDADILAHFDNIPMLFNSIYNKLDDNQKSTNNVKQILRVSLEKDYNDLSERTKREFYERYKQIFKNVLNESVNKKEDVVDVRKLENKVAVVTGGAMGNGYGIVKVFLKYGAKVVILDYDESTYDVARSLSDNENMVLGYKVDIRNMEDVKRCITEVTRVFGKIDILVNNAGVCRLEKFEDMDDELRDFHFDINIKGTWNVTKACLPHMKNRKASIINLSSVTGPMVADSGEVAYATTKSAILGFTKGLAAELVNDDIRVNAIMPGYIRTPMVDNMAILSNKENPESVVRGIANAIPMKRLGTIEELGELAAFLASEESSYITAQGIVIDGGSTLPETMTMGV